jgi:hypothetical protein
MRQLRDAYHAEATLATLRQQLTEARDEAEEYRLAAHANKEALTEAQTDLAAARSEQAGERADKDRMDWLEDRIVDSCGKKFFIADEPSGGIVEIETWGASELRTLIDVARATTPTSQGPTHAD